MNKQKPGIWLCTNASSNRKSNRIILIGFRPHFGLKFFSKLNLLKWKLKYLVRNGNVGQDIKRKDEQSRSQNATFNQRISIRTQKQDASTGLFKVKL